MFVPDQERWHAKKKMEAQSEHVHVAHNVFRTTGARFVCSVGDYQQKISASELRRKLVKSALLVGWLCIQVPRYFFFFFCEGIITQEQNWIRERVRS